MNTINSLQEITQTTNNYLKDFIPPIITTTTTQDYVPDMNKLTLSNEINKDEVVDTIPTLAETTLTETAANLIKKDIKFTDKEVSELTINQIYNNTIKTSISIINDISELISEKDMLTNTEFRREMVNIFFMKERRMYVGILLILISFILYFIDSST